MGDSPEGVIYCGAAVQSIESAEGGNPARYGESYQISRLAAWCWAPWSDHRHS
jgi:hypothetical protein